MSLSIMYTDFKFPVSMMTPSDLTSVIQFLHNHHYSRTSIKMWTHHLKSNSINSSRLLSLEHAKYSTDIPSGRIAFGSTSNHRINWDQISDWKEQFHIIPWWMMIIYRRSYVQKGVIIIWTFKEGCTCSISYVTCRLCFIHCAWLAEVEANLQLH